MVAGETTCCQGYNSIRLLYNSTRFLTTSPPISVHILPSQTVAGTVPTGGFVSQNEDQLEQQKKHSGPEIETRIINDTLEAVMAQGDENNYAMDLGANDKMEDADFGEDKNATEREDRLPQVAASNSSTPKQLTVKIGRPWGGQMCNRLLVIGAAFEFARYKKAKLILHEEWVKYLNEFADLDRLKERSEVDYVLQEAEPGNTTFTLNVKYALRCGTVAASKWIREALRPNKQHREQGEAVIEQIRKDAERAIGPSGRSLPLISIHLRREDFVCRNGTFAGNAHQWFSKWQVCHGDTRHLRIDKERFCKHSLDDYFYDSIRAEAPHLNLTNYSVFVSTDWQDEIRDATFFNENLKKRYGVVASRKTPKGTPMAVDMWVSAHSDLHTANGYTSCGPILATWRAEMRTDGRNWVAPQSCYKGFGDPMTVPMCFGRRYEKRMLTPR